MAAMKAKVVQRARNITQYLAGLRVNPDIELTLRAQQDVNK